MRSHRSRNGRALPDREESSLDRKDLLYSGIWFIAYPCISRVGSHGREQSKSTTRVPARRRRFGSPRPIGSVSDHYCSLLTIPTWRDGIHRGDCFVFSCRRHLYRSSHTLPFGCNDPNTHTFLLDRLRHRSTPVSFRSLCRSVRRLRLIDRQTQRVTTRHLYHHIVSKCPYSTDISQLL